VRITTPKLTGPELAWAPFKGWSVLFDTDLGPHQRQQGGAEPPEPLELLELPGKLIAGHDLYRTLSVWSFDLVRRQQPAGYLPLPPSSYHVTVCDGLSDAQLNEAQGPARQRIAQMLESLPGAVLDPVSLVPSAAAALAQLVESATSPIDLRFAGIESRGHALVVGLEPAQHSRSAYSMIVEARDALLSTLGAEFGIDLTSPWRPHVSVGYWANQEVADEHEELVAAGARTVIESAPNAGVRVGRASVHAFDDMETYWRAGTRSISVQRRA